ncbi:hypothetical protein F5Y16DRAFT_40777 [Xylariaceae sp. FL0255]|nr:hypothetical protein F5Y16DRAFT_40777 [Xylariaceae sp. FL0255]
MPKCGSAIGMVVLWQLITWPWAETNADCEPAWRKTESVGLHYCLTYKRCRNILSSMAMPSACAPPEQIDGKVACLGIPISAPYPSS